MIKYLIQGFLLGIAYVAPIGMQNLYVINTAVTMNRKRALQVALITIFFDISLALACFYGMGLLMDRVPVLKNGFILIGSLAVIWIGISLIRSAPTIKEVKTEQSLLKVASICFAVTWLNPQAIIDGSLLLGGFRASLKVDFSTIFIIGVAIASFTWFISLAGIVSVFRSAFNTKVIKVINVICGLVIIVFGIRLGLSLIEVVGSL